MSDLTHLAVNYADININAKNFQAEIIRTRLLQIK